MKIYTENFTIILSILQIKSLTPVNLEFFAIF